MRLEKFNILKGLKTDLNSFSVGEKAVLMGTIEKEIKALEATLKEFQAFYALVIALNEIDE